MKIIKKMLLIIFVLFGVSVCGANDASAAVKIDATNFPDDFVRSTVSKKDTNGDGTLSDEELKKVSYIRFDSEKKEAVYGTITDQEITTFKGMEYFSSISQIGLSKIKATENLLLYFPQIEWIDSSASNISLKGSAPNLEILTIAHYDDEFFEIDLEAKNLKYLSFQASLTLPKQYSIKAPNLETILLQGVVDISKIETSGKKVRRIAVKGELSGKNAGYTFLDFSKYPNVEELDCSYNKNLTSINISGLKKLKSLDASNCKLKSINVKKNTKLEILWLSYNKIKSINLSKNKKLRLLRVSNNKIKKLNLSKNTKLFELVCSGLSLKKLDLSKNKKLSHFGASDAKIGTLKLPVLGSRLYTSSDWDELEQFRLGIGKIKTLDISKLKSLKSLKSTRSESIHLKKDFFKKKYGLKKVIISKKLKKADKKYIKKLAKKCKVKVVVKK